MNEKLTYKILHFGSAVDDVIIRVVTGNPPEGFREISCGDGVWDIDKGLFIGSSSNLPKEGEIK